jgi:hypothetical protein
VSYATGDCTGAATPLASESGTIVTVGDATATLETANVTAQAIDVTVSGAATVYDILYVDTAPEPDVMYFSNGESATPAGRPTLLQPGSGLEKQ